MKELSIEQKAKAYDEALKVLHKYDGANIMFSQSLKEEMFPELKESEDERIKNIIKKSLRVYFEGNLAIGTNDTDYAECLAWLEKQGQKPTDIQSIEKRAYEVFPDDDDENTPLYRQAFIDGAVDYIDCGCKKSSAWSKEDENEFNHVIKTLKSVEEEQETKGYNNLIGSINWLKSLKDRAGCKVNCTTTKKWSKEDDYAIERLFCLLDNEQDNYPQLSCNFQEIQEIKEWLKSLRPQNWTKEDRERYISCLQRLGTGNPEQPETINSKWFKEHVYPKNTWKPSDEQMKALEHMVNYANFDEVKNRDIVRILLNELKKLREE